MFRNLFTIACFAYPLQLCAQDLDLSLPDMPPGDISSETGNRVQEREQTWFGMGYESRRKEQERVRYKERATESTVFSRGAMPAGSPGAISAGRSGGGGNGRR